MKKIFFAVLLLFGALNAKAQDVRIIDYNELAPILNQTNDTVYVINFWASWCQPCVEELPYFKKVYNENKDKNFRMILVSLDFPRQLDSRVKPFIKKHGLNMEILLLDDPDANAWINKVDESWTGSIPATLILYNGIREFYEKQLSYEELNQIVLSKL